MTILPDDVTRLFTVGEIRVSYQRERPALQRIQCSRDAFDALRQHWSDSITYREEFYILCLDRANNLIGVYLVSTGTVTSCLVDPRAVFQVLLGTNATNVILAHNHPSESLVPSEQDKQLTSRLKECGRLFDITIFDHLIVTANPVKYFSFADEGIL